MLNLLPQKLLEEQADLLVYFRGDLVLGATGHSDTVWVPQEAVDSNAVFERLPSFRGILRTAGDKKRPGGSWKSAIVMWSEKELRPLFPPDDLAFVVNVLREGRKTIREVERRVDAMIKQEPMSKGIPSRSTPPARWNS